MEVVADFLFLGSKITVDGDCSHEIRRQLLLGRKAMTNLESVLKSEDVTFPTKVCIVKPRVFPVVMYRYESWQLTRLSPELMLSNSGVSEESWESLGKQRDQTSQSQRKSILNALWKDWCWSWSSNALATWYEQLTHWKRPGGWERLNAEGEESGRGLDHWMASPIQRTWIWANSGRWWGTWKPGMLQSMGSWRVRHNLVTEQQQNVVLIEFPKNKIVYLLVLIIIKIMYYSIYYVNIR